MASMRKLPAARRKTLCDITNLRCADGVDAVARLVQENLDLTRLLKERDKFIELSGAEMQNLRLANWQLAQANSQMLTELNLGKTRLKSLQHELTCSRAALKVKSSELEEAKKVIRSSRQQQQKNANEMARHLDVDRAAAAQLKDGDAEPTSDALYAASASKPACNASRKRLPRSRYDGGIQGKGKRTETVTEKVASYKEMPVNIGAVPTQVVARKAASARHREGRLLQGDACQH